jgi:hypothetical protein
VGSEPGLSRTFTSGSLEAAPSGLALSILDVESSTEVIIFRRELSDELLCFFD